MRDPAAPELVPSLRPRFAFVPALWVIALFVGLFGLQRLTARTPPAVTVPQKPLPTPRVPMPADDERFAPPTADWVAAMRAGLQPLQELAPPMPRPRPGDWLDQHPESGQSFGDYYRTYVIRPTPRRHIIYVQPLGSFTEAERQIVALTAEYLARYFNLPVWVQPELPLRVVPGPAFRRHPSQGMTQLHTGTILREVLKPRLPDDAVVYLAFTAIDLFPQPDWNFVFGEASLRDRVGVWSLARNGDPGRSAQSFRLCLLRTLKIATHETGHMFGMAHCTAHPCNMNGVNSLDEADRAPLDLCPDCLAKVALLTATEPQVLLRGMADFHREHGLVREEQGLRRALDALDRSRRAARASR